MEKRNYSLDILRSGMMFLGILLHAIWIAKPELPFIDARLSEKIFALLWEVIHTFRMPLFMCLCGYLSILLLQKLGVKKFLKNRTNRIIIPLILSFFTIGLLSKYFYHVNNFVSKGLSFEEAINAVNSSFKELVLYDYFFLGHLWFLFYLSLFILSLCLIRSLLNLVAPLKELYNHGAIKGKLPTLTFIYIVVLSVIPTFILFITKNNGNPTPLSLIIKPGVYLFYFYYFLIGCIVYKANFTLDIFKKNSGLFLTLAFILSVARFVLWTQSGTKMFLIMVSIYNISVWVYIISLIGISQNILKKPSGLLQYFSDSSYWVYLIHYPVILFIKSIMANDTSLSALIILLFLTISISFLSYHFLIRSTFLGRMLNGKTYAFRPLRDSSTIRNLEFNLKKRFAFSVWRKLAVSKLRLARINK